MSEEEKAELEELYENSEWWHNRFNAVQRDYENLQQRIDKAREYIYRNWITYDEATKFTTFNEEMEVCIKEIKELLEILGDKEDESR